MEYLWVLEPDSKYDVPDNRHNMRNKYIQKSVMTLGNFTVPFMR